MSSKVNFFIAVYVIADEVLKCIYYFLGGVIPITYNNITIHSKHLRMSQPVFCGKKNPEQISCSLQGPGTGRG